jgi:GNAT superfamily N-acetyltransferase
MNEINFLVRRATSSDLERLISFAIAEASEAEKTARSSEPIREGVRVGLEGESIAMYWVLEKENSEVIGNVSVVKEWSNWNSGYYWWIQSMFLHPEYRGKGLMDRLIEVVKEAAKKEEAVELRLYVHNRNERAIKAYRKSGFLDSDYRIMTMPL